MIFLLTFSGAALLLCLGYFALRIAAPSYRSHPIIPTAAASIAAGVLCVFVISELLVRLFGNSFFLSSTRSFILVFLITLSVGVISFAIVKPTKTELLSRNKHTLSFLFPSLVIGSTLLIPLVFNWYAQDNDGFLSTIIKYWEGSLLNPLDLRPAYSTGIAIINQILGTNPVATYAWIPPILFTLVLVGLMPLFYNRYSLVLLLCAPVIAIEMSITRPQAFLLVYTLPFLLSLSQWNKKTGWKWLLASFLIALALLPVHELAALYGLVVVLFITIRVLRDLFVTKTLPIKRVLIWIGTIAPYMFILYLLNTFAQLHGMFSHVLANMGNLNLRWWFLHSYTSIDGANLGWEGISAIQYYLYNGILLIAVCLVTFFIFFKTVRNSINELLPPLLFTSIYIGFAEILPRFGFYFLLNRSWPFISLGLVAALIIILERKSEKIRNTTYALLLLPPVLVGYIGVILVAKDNISLVYPEEIGVVSTLKNLTEDSVIISHQPNQALVTIYGKRKFRPITNNPLSLDEMNMNNSITSITRSPEITTITETTVTQLQDGNIIDKRTQVSETKAKNTTVIPPSNIYYLYSRRKDQGISGERNSQYTDNVITKEGISDFLANKTTIYDDGVTVLVKL